MPNTPSGTNKSTSRSTRMMMKVVLYWMLSCLIDSGFGWMQQDVEKSVHFSVCVNYHDFLEFTVSFRQRKQLEIFTISNYIT